MAGPARADDYVSVRGVYYREPSTRVIQPMVEVERDSPSGIDVGAHFLVDAITSASIRRGDRRRQRVHGDAERGGAEPAQALVALATWSSPYKYSAESDYWSHAVGVSGGRALWGDTATLRLSLGRSFDTMTSRGPARPTARRRGQLPAPWTSGSPGSPTRRCCRPVAIAQVSYEVAYLEGFQGNLYRTSPG